MLADERKRGYGCQPSEPLLSVGDNRKRLFVVLIKKFIRPALGNPDQTKCSCLWHRRCASSRFLLPNGHFQEVYQLGSKNTRGGEFNTSHLHRVSEQGRQGLLLLGGGMGCIQAGQYHLPEV